jgi:hypothetical protein
MMQPADDRRHLRIFLSHRYKSAAVNQRFFDLINESAVVQFEVDEGLKATSTTRLERMIRDVDAFVGIYALHDDPYVPAPPDRVASAARYFKLELDIALRHRKPAITFIDRRFGNELSSAPSGHRFAVQDLLSQGGLPARRRLAGHWAEFCRTVADHVPPEPDSVGVLLSPGAAQEAVADLIKVNHLLEELPTALDDAAVAGLRRCDWVLVDMSHPAAIPVVAFLRGHGIPVLRIAPDGRRPDPAAEHLLYGRLASHYTKDLISWTDTEDLISSVRERMERISQYAKLIDGHAQAQDHFLKAAKINKRVFVSYAKEDAEYAGRISAALRGRFQEVFNYQETPMKHGSQWLDEMLSSLAASAVGVPLMSPHYANSVYCMEEGRRMASGHVEGRMRVFPILLDGRELDLFKTLQRVRADRLKPEEIVDGIVAEVSA